MGGIAMTHVEIYEEPAPAEMTGLRMFLLSLADRATWCMDFFTTFCCEVPALIVLFVVFLFLVMCHTESPGSAAVTASLLWWFLVMTTGRYTLRGIIAAALLYEICQLLSLNWFLADLLNK
jgi:hypothetical protein